MKLVNRFLVFVVLSVAGHVVHAQAPMPTQGADVPELMRLLEKKKSDRYLRINMQNKQLQGAQLANTDLSGINLDGANLSNAKLQGCIFAYAVLKQTIMTEADLSGANFSGSVCQNVNFKNAILAKADFTDATLESTGISNAKLDFTNAKCMNALFVRSTLRYANLQGADLTNAKLNHATLIGCDLKKAILTDATFTDATFNNVDARATNFTRSEKGFTSIKFSNDTYFNNAIGLTLRQQEYARSKGVIGVPGEDMPKLVALLKQRQSRPNTPIDIENADLGGVQLDEYGADLRNARLPGANLRGARVFGSLEGAQLPGADLDGAAIGGNFTNVNLQGAKLTNITQATYPHFISADLRGADFTGSVMPNAKFTNANLADAKGLSPQLKELARLHGARNVPQ